MRRRGDELAAEDMEWPAGDDPGIVTSLARGLSVLRAFRRADRTLGNQDLARRTGLPKATVSRLTYTLSRLGYLVYLPDTANYRLGPGALALGFTTLGAMGIRDVARPLMQALADASGAASALGIRDGMSMVYVESCRGDSAIRVDLDTGSHIKLATSAMGRAYVAGLSEADRARLMQRLEAREGERWPAMRLGLEAAIEDYRARGFVVSAGDWKSEVHAVGVPLAVGTGELAFAVNLGGPAYMFPRERLLADLGPRLVKMAERIRRELFGEEDAEGGAGGVLVRGRPTLGGDPII